MRSHPMPGASAPNRRLRRDLTVLRTLKLRFADRPDYDLSFESADDESDPWRLLAGRAGDDGRIRLGDRESCALDDVLDVEFVEPEAREGPGFARGLQDEDAATALDENYGTPE